MKFKPSEAELRIMHGLKAQQFMAIDKVSFNEEHAHIMVEGPAFSDEDMGAFAGYGLEVVGVEPNVDKNGQAKGVILHLNWRTA